MSDFNSFLKKVENTDKDTLISMVYDLSAKVSPALMNIIEDGKSAIYIFCTFLLTALAADGRLADEEFEAVDPMFKALFGDSFDYKDCKKMVKNADDKKTMELMVNLVHNVPAEVGQNLVLLAIVICAVDGDVSRKERAYIEKLLG